MSPSLPERRWFYESKINTISIKDIKKNVKELHSEQGQFHREIYQLFKRQTIPMIFKFFKSTEKERKLTFCQGCQHNMFCQDCTKKEKPDQIPKNINVAKILLNVTNQNTAEH